MTVFNVIEKQQKSHFCLQFLLLKSSLQTQKSTFTAKFSPSSSLEVIFFCSYSLLGSSYSTAHAKLTTVSRDASRFSRDASRFSRDASRFSRDASRFSRDASRFSQDESRFSRVHCKYRTNTSHSADVKCIQNYRTSIYTFGQIRAYDARLNKPNDRTLFHGELRTVKV